MTATVADSRHDDQGFRAVFGTGRLTTGAPAEGFIASNLARLKDIPGAGAEWLFGQSAAPRIVIGCAEGTGNDGRVTFVSGHDTFAQAEAQGLRRRALGDMLPTFAFELDRPDPQLLFLSWMFGTHPGQDGMRWHESGLFLSDEPSFETICARQAEFYAGLPGKPAL